MRRGVLYWGDVSVLGGEVSASPAAQEVALLSEQVGRAYGKEPLPNRCGFRLWIELGPWEEQARRGLL